MSAATESARRAAMEQFLTAAGCGGVEPQPLAGDASFRRYYRLHRDGANLVLMDAPPPIELPKLGAYIAVSRILRRFGLSAPEIYAEDRARGFLLIEDFGDDGYPHLLAAGADPASLYALAIDTLIALQRAVAAGRMPELPPYDEERLLNEAALFIEWYAPSVLRAPLPQAALDDYLARWRSVLANAAEPGPTMIMRDYIPDNLMLLSGRAGVRRCGLIDIQDAVLGPAAYDVASLLRDARRDVPVALQAAMTQRYIKAFPDLDAAQFRRASAILAVQRNCKILGIFTRLWRRDDKPGYLVHIPRIWRLIEEDLQREPALAAISEWLARHLPAEVRREPPARSAA